MGRNKAKEAVAYLMAAFPNRAIDEATLSVYLDQLGGIDPELLTRAVKESVQNSRFFPTIAELRESCAKIVCDLPHPSAVSEVLRNPASIHSTHPMIKRSIIEALGPSWPHEYRTSTRPSLLRRDVESVYARLSASLIRDTQTCDDAINLALAQMGQPQGLLPAPKNDD